MTPSSQRPGDLSAAAHSMAATPHELYGELFVAVQMMRVFGDGKSFVDARPRTAPALIRVPHFLSHPIPVAR